jgi:hypothetical protein
MRRYFFYSAVAFLAFALSSLIVFSLLTPNRELPAIAQPLSENKPEIVKRDFPKAESSQMLDDEESMSFEVLKPTIKKWLQGEKIESRFTEVSDQSIKEITGRNKSELDEVDTFGFSELRFEPTLIDVNGDGKKELAIRNNCAMVGNCQFWLFKKKGNDYQIILKTLVVEVQTFKLKHNKTNGYFDLETKDHGDAWSGGIYIYKFDGEKYKAVECSDYNYSYLKDGKFHQFKKPKITRWKCVED